MIAVIDSSISERSKAVRKKLFMEGFPSASLTIDELEDFKPVKLIVTFYSVFNELRHHPYDEICAVVIGDGFVPLSMQCGRKTKTKPLSWLKDIS